MTSRLENREAAKGAIEAMLGLEKYLAQSGLEPVLLDLVRLRASQINGCAYCLDMHWKDLRARGENEQKLYLLDAWRESPFYSDRERAALRGPGLGSWGGPPRQSGVDRVSTNRGLGECLPKVDTLEYPDLKRNGLPRFVSPKGILLFGRPGCLSGFGVFRLGPISVCGWGKHLHVPRNDVI